MSVMFPHLGRFAVVAGAVCASFARPAAAQSPPAETVRESRPGLLAFTPTWPWMAHQDVTIPLPSLRVSVNMSPRLTVDMTGGMFPQLGEKFWLLDIGARTFLTGGHLSPYVMARVGMYHSVHDETPDQTYRYGTLGAGVEYAANGGFTAWAELGPALLDSERGWYGSFGLGYRFGSPPRPR
jgi:hypothetical protein